MNNSNYKNVNVNFKKAHKDIYEWLRKYCDEKGYSLSHLIRELISDLKKDVEGENE